jgi:hypothetical protein
MALPDEVEKTSREIDSAVPRKHAFVPCNDAFTQREASVLAQLRAGMTRINEYLLRIGAAELDQCGCGGCGQQGRG